MPLILPESSQSLRNPKENLKAKRVLSTKQYKDNDILWKNFEFDIKKLSRELPINPFMSIRLHKINNDWIVVPDFMFERIKSVEDIGVT